MLIRTLPKRRARPQLFNFIADRGAGEQLAYVDQIDVIKKFNDRPTKDRTSHLMARILPLAGSADVM